MSPTTIAAIYVAIAVLSACLFIALFGDKRSEKLTRDSDAEELRRQMKGVGVHAHPTTVSEAYHHVH
jgi:hypothetical protein